MAGIYSKETYAGFRDLLNVEDKPAFSSSSAAINILMRIHLHKPDLSRPLRVSELNALKYIQSSNTSVEDFTDLLSTGTEKELGRLLHYTDKFRSNQNTLPSVRTSKARNVINFLKIDSTEELDYSDVNIEELKKALSTAKDNTSKKSKKMDGIARLKLAIYNNLEKLLDKAS